MDVPFFARPEFASNSVSDLLAARDAYHVHLLHKRNVVATAIGRYLIRADDWFAEHPPEAGARRAHPKPQTRRTLFDSVVRPWSWPCVLVFVDSWMHKHEFADEPDQMVPRALYLPDGRVVPTCVVCIAYDDAAPAPLASVPSVRNAVGPGCAIVSEVQGAERVGTIGAIVGDGSRYYALTNKHVAGPPGQVARVQTRGALERVGVGAAASLGKLPFSAAYRGWSGTDTVVNLDAGLVEIDDISDWTPGIVELGEPGEPLDLRPDTLTLDLIRKPVRGYGAASGRLDGTIAAFFYRYRTQGGREYLADFLIAPDGEAQTRPGDSGTLWHLVVPSAEPPAGRRGAPTAPETLRPFAMQWGGHEIVPGPYGMRAQGFALASALSTICRELDLDVVRGWDRQLPDYWGDVGHYTIAAKACTLATTPELFTLLANNRENISYADENIRPGTFKGLSNAPFVPLADVPDKVWKMHGPGARGGPEHPNHFADMDKPDPKTGGGTLLDATSDGRGGTDKAKVRIATFASYYADVADASRGCLPFRVWQLFEVMLAATTAAEFVCAAGVLAHYVGDACQPLHISYLFDGIPSADGAVRGKGVHAAYESKMVGAHAAELLSALDAELRIDAHGRGAGRRSDIATGEDAAAAVVQLMRETFATIAPQTIVDAYVADPSIASLWRRFAEPTVTVLALGARTLARVYDGAWNANPNALATDLVPPGKLSALYLRPTWAPSKTLGEIGSIIPNAR